VGSLRKPKNHRLLINAFSEIAHKITEYKLCIYMGGQEDIYLILLKISPFVLTSYYEEGYFIYIGAIENINSRV